MPTHIISPDQADQARAIHRRRSRLPAAPWVELLGFLLMIALAVTGTR